MLKLNVGFNRKIGEANYSSRGASVNLELELDSGLAGDPERLKERVRQMFLLAKASVEEELHAPATANTNGKGTNGHQNGRQQTKARRATASQVRALHAIADRQHLDLATVLRERFRTDQAEELSITEASELIDSLKGATNGKGTEGHQNGRQQTKARRATASQVRALRAIADRQHLDLATVLSERFGTDQAEELSITEASELIDSLKGATHGNGQGGRR